MFVRTGLVGCAGGSFFSRRMGWVMGRQFLCHVFIGFQYVFCPVTERTKCIPSTTCLNAICIINLYYPVHSGCVSNPWEENKVQ